MRSSLSITHRIHSTQRSCEHASTTTTAAAAAIVDTTAPSHPQRYNALLQLNHPHTLPERHAGHGVHSNAARKRGRRGEGDAQLPRRGNHNERLCSRCWLRRGNSCNNHNLLYFKRQHPHILQQGHASNRIHGNSSCLCRGQHVWRRCSDSRRHTSLYRSAQRKHAVEAKRGRRCSCGRCAKGRCRRYCCGGWHGGSCNHRRDGCSVRCVVVSQIKHPYRRVERHASNWVNGDSDGRGSGWRPLCGGRE